MPESVALSPRLPRFALLTDVGRVRRGNEDACAADAEAGVFVVCDGMGGAAAGEVASRLAADTFLAELKRPAGGLRGTTPERLEVALRDTNLVVFARSRSSRQMHGMGTTLVAVVLEPAVQPEAVHLLHVGDSRCYLLRGGVLRLLTMDHSLVEEQVREGVMTRLQADHSPMRNVITRAIGSHPQVEPEIQMHRPEAGDLLLLASDGLTRELLDEEIAEILRKLPERPEVGALEKACAELIGAANYNGGHDNVTVILVSLP